MDYQEQVVQIAYRGMELSAREMLLLMRHVLERRNAVGNQIVHGEQSLKKLNEQNRALEKANAAVEGLLPSISARLFFISPSSEALASGLIGAVIMWFIYIYNAFSGKKYMLGREHGSAECGA